MVHITRIEKHAVHVYVRISDTTAHAANSPLHLETSGEASRAMHALLAVLKVGVEPLGPVALPPRHVVVREESSGVLDGGHHQLTLVAVVHLRVKQIVVHSGN